jgi:hypothetical protein
MARAKNENKLSSGFYRAHDFLRFGDVIGSINAGRKGDWKNQAMQMAQLQSVNKLGFPFPDIHQADWSDECLRAIHGYGVYCNNEYDAWIDSLKFQFESGLLHQVIPPKAILNNFFGDLEVRMPHEQTLLIENHPGGITFCVRVEETTIRAWVRKYMDVTKLTKSLEYKTEKDFWDHLNAGFSARNPLNEDGKVTKTYEWYKGLDQEIAAIRLTINCNVSENTIEAPETFKKEQLDAMTNNLTTMIPSIYFAPLGKTVEFYDREPAIFFHHNFLGNNVGHDKLVRSQHHLACSFTQPYTTPGFPVEKSFLEKTFQGSGSKKTFLYPWVEDVKKSKHPNNRHVNGEDLSDAPLAHWELARQVFLHMGIMNHPEFKSLCVEKLKMNGIQPNKSPYSAARPYTTRPAWRPPFEHYVVTINIPDEVSNESNASTHKKRHHLVRGHYMRTASKGFVWRKSHWRGNREMGVVTKDYVMDLEDKLQKTGRDDEKNIALNLRG